MEAINPIIRMRHGGSRRSIVWIGSPELVAWTLATAMAHRRALGGCVAGIRLGAGMPGAPSPAGP